jgi:WD40 repeat protein
MIRASLIGCLCVSLSSCGGSKPAQVIAAPPASVSAVVQAVDAGVATPAATLFSTNVRSEPFTNAAILPSGNVLVTSRNAVFVWDPRSSGVPRRAEIAEADRGPFVHSGSTRFVAMRNTDGKVTLDLWDAEALVKLKTLDGSWKDTSDGFGAFSPDGSRFFFAACTPDCEAATYALPEGKLVKRTNLGKLDFGMYLPSVVASPTGKFFALSHESMSTRAYETETGKLAYVVAEPQETYFGGGAKCIFLDERLLLTSSGNGRKLQITNLETGKRASGVDLKLTRDDFPFEHTLSPDRKRMAILVRHGRGANRELALWDVAGDTFSKHVLPGPACPDYCDVHWLTARSLVVQAQKRAEIQWRLDVESGTPATDPFEPAPTFSSGGFRVFGAVDPEPAVAVTETGARVGLPKLKPNDSALSVYDARLLLVTSKAIDVVTKDGAFAELTTSR